MTALLTLESVSKTFGDDPPMCPVKQVDLIVNKGEVVVIHGESGCGKSTLLNLIGGLLCPDTGRVLYEGKDIATLNSAELDRAHRHKLGFIFQEPHLIAALTAQENLELAARLSAREGESNLADAIAQALEDFGLIAHAGYLPSELSLGQRRRLVSARTFLTDPTILLADEPTNDLDAYWADYIVERLSAHAAKGNHCVVMVTHDPRYTNRANRSYLMTAGRLVLCS